MPGEPDSIWITWRKPLPPTAVSTLGGSPVRRTTAAAWPSSVVIDSPYRPRPAAQRESPGGLGTWSPAWSPPTPTPAPPSLWARWLGVGNCQKRLPRRRPLTPRGGPRLWLRDRRPARCAPRRLHLSRRRDLDHLRVAVWPACGRSRHLLPRASHAHGQGFSHRQTVAQMETSPYDTSTFINDLSRRSRLTLTRWRASGGRR